MRSLIWKGIQKFFFVQFDMHLNLFFWHFVVIPNVFAQMFSLLKSSAFFLRDAKNPDVDLENYGYEKGYCQEFKIG